MSARIESAATIVLATAAVTVVAMMIRDRMKPPQQLPGDRTVAVVANWNQALAISTPAVRRPGATTLIEFMDLECPFCATYDGTVKELERVFGDSVQLHVVHMPIPGHKFARSGALAIECAAQQSKWREFISNVFDQKDSIGLKPWATFAKEIGISDTTAFISCTNLPSIAQKVDSAAKISRSLKIPGTPTLLIDGWRFNGGQSTEELIRAVRLIRSGKAPTD